MIRLNGKLLDIEPAVRGFQRFSSESRANMEASHRLGFRQKHRIGESFWTHPRVPGIAFPTRKQALLAALAALSACHASSNRCVAATPSEQWSGHWSADRRECVRDQAAT